MMADKTGIEWTDATWNPVTGCAKVSAGCKHCYAERNWGRLQQLSPLAAITDRCSGRSPMRASQSRLKASPLAHRGRSRVAVLPGQETVDGRLRHATALFERVSVLVSQCHQGFQ